jgi:hypothetical protein
MFTITLIIQALILIGMFRSWLFDSTNKKQDQLLEGQKEQKELINQALRVLNEHHARLSVVEDRLER